MNAQTEIHADKLAIWEALSKTDPRHTKEFKRAGGFSGTALKPIWIIQRLTKQFGPCGEGWGMGRPEFQVVAGENREVLVYCTVSCWHGHPENTLYGVGGDKIVTYIKANEKYNRPERWESDDEAFKKAFTDAVNNAFKFVGVGADIHMGQFEDNKYVQDTAREFEEEERAEPQKVPGITKIKARLNKLMNDGNRVTSLIEFNALVGECKDELTAIKEAHHDYWTGDGGDEHEGFKKWIVRRRRELTPPDASELFLDLVESLNQCDDRDDMKALVESRAECIAKLDGEESRKFEALYDERDGIYAAGKTPLVPAAA